SGGVGGDLRDLEAAAAEGNPDAQLAIDTYVQEIRRHLGSMLVALGGCDALVFTGGIGENGANVRAEVCSGLDELGLQIDATANADLRGVEGRVDGAASRSQIWVIPTNEELIVARQTAALIANQADR
ncbi:MAG: acetate/propionate family kinase, partial [Planctomycetota bacterium]